MHWRACVYTRLGEGGSYIWAGEGGAERACAWAAGTGSSLHAGSSASASARLGRAAASMLSPEGKPWAAEGQGPRAARKLLAIWGQAGNGVFRIQGLPTNCAESWGRGAWPGTVERRVFPERGRRRVRLG